MRASLIVTDRAATLRLTADSDFERHILDMVNGNFQRRTVTIDVQKVEYSERIKTACLEVDFAGEPESTQLNTHV